jgi:hypothetical protein
MGEALASAEGAVWAWLELPVVVSALAILGRWPSQ